MIAITAHLNEAELEAKYVGCSDACRSRHLQAIRLLETDARFSLHCSWSENDLNLHETKFVDTIFKVKTPIET